MSRVLLFVFLLSQLYCSAQSVDTHAFNPQADSLRGKLLLINEVHGVKSNTAEYESLIRTWTADFDEKDTLNIFIEAPYSLTAVINNYLRGESRALIDSVLRNDPDKIEYFFALRKLKKNIRFYGVDFEYDHGTTGARLEAYKSFFDDLKKELERAGYDLSVVRSFLYGIRVQGLEEADIFTFRKYVQKLRINQADSVLRIHLKDANFILTARPEWDKDELRDKVCFSRFQELISAGIDVAHSYNMMIYGSSHVNPLNSKSLYNKLNTEENSPFRNAIFLLANYYDNCLSAGAYNDRSITLETNGLYIGNPEDKLVRDLIKNQLPQGEANSFHLEKNTLTGEWKDFKRILYFGIHDHVK